MGAIASSPGEIAVFIAVFGVLLSLQASLGHEWRFLLVTASLIGVCFSVAGLVLDARFCLYVALALLLPVAIATVVALAAEGPISAPSLLRRVPDAFRDRRSTLAFALGLCLLVAAGVSIGLLARNSGGPSPASIVVPGKYRVSGTCVNGACTVNECVHRAPCGLENEGRLHEGTAVDIVCQALGKMAEAPNGQKSHIWDRLPSGLYISDLFVEGTRTGQFTPALRRCAAA
jgi:hypothetical protein